MAPGDFTMTHDKGSDLAPANSTVLVSRDKFSSAESEGSRSSEPQGSSRGGDDVSDDEDNDSDTQKQVHQQLRDELNKHLERTTKAATKTTTTRKKRSRPRKAVKQPQTPSIGTDEESNMSSEQQYGKRGETPVGPPSSKTTRSKKQKHGKEQLDR